MRCLWLRTGLVLMPGRRLGSGRVGGALVAVGWSRVVLVGALVPWTWLGSLVAGVPGRALVGVGVWVGGFFVMAAAWRWRRGQAAGRQAAARFLAWWWMPVAVVVVIGVGVVTSWWLLTQA